MPYASQISNRSSVALTRAIILMMAFLFCLRADASASRIRINEVYYDPPGPSAEEATNEFIELYVVNGGFSPAHWYVTDWDASNAWEIPASFPTVQTGEFIVIHIGPGSNDLVGPVYHLYKGSSTSQLSNTGDPISLHEDVDSTHNRQTDTVHDFMTYEAGTDSELALCSPWAGWSNDGVNPTDPGPTSPNDQWKSVQLIGEDLDNGSNWIAIEPTEGTQNSATPPVHWAANIAGAKAYPDGTVVGVTAIVHTPIGPLNYERRQFWLQDYTAGIVVDNTPEKTTRPYAAGDVVSLTGTLSTTGKLRQLLLEADPGPALGSSALVSPKYLSVSSYRDSVIIGLDEYQSQLIKFEAVCFDATPPLSWTANTSYRIRSAGASLGSATAYIRIEDGCELTGQPVPSTSYFSVTGEASRYNSYPRILPRYVEDLIIPDPNSVAPNSWKIYR